MAAIPVLEELTGTASGQMIADLAGVSSSDVSLLDRLRESSLPGSPRKLSVYAASAGFEMVEELDHLATRAIEPNVFFNPRFLAPAMPRLEDREVFLAVMRDENDIRSRLRFLLPYSVERPGLGIGPSIIRAWSSPYGPLGAPLIDRDDPVGTVDDFLKLLARPSLGLPPVLVLPDMPLDGEAASIIRTAAMGRNLSLLTAQTTERAILQSNLEGDDYLRGSLKSHHFREFRRLWRRLAEKGELHYHVSRHPDDIRQGCESFLTLELMGWKGRERTAMASDRFQAAFAREAIHRLAEQDMVRVHTLTLDGEVIAALLVLVERGIAYTWKTAYDETLSTFSPGTLLMIEATKNILDDPNIDSTDSCAVPGHPVMERLWSERKRMGTLVIGLTPQADRLARQTATQLHLYNETRNFARNLRNRVRGFMRRR